MDAQDFWQNSNLSRQKCPCTPHPKLSAYGQVDTLDSLLLVLNQSRITSLRLHIHPYLPWVPIRVFETLLIPSLRILHFEQPLTAACIEPFAGFLQSATNLQSLRVSRISDQEAVSALIEGLLRANVPYVGYNFDRGSNVLDIDLAPLSPTSPTSLNFPTFPVEQKVNQRRSSATKYTARKRSTTSSLVHVTRY